MPPDSKPYARRKISAPSRTLPRHSKPGFSTRTLHVCMYMYDSDYQLRDNPLPQRLRDIVKRCMLQTNDLAQKLRSLANEHNVEEISLHINSDSSARAAHQPESSPHSPRSQPNARRRLPRSISTDEAALVPQFATIPPIV